MEFPLVHFHSVEYVHESCVLTLKPSLMSFLKHWAKVASAEKDVDSHLPLLHPDGLLGSDERADRDPGGEAKQDGREGSIQLLQ